jgi:anaerobic selenocysteine-containing dehydrogenase
VDAHAGSAGRTEPTEVDPRVTPVARAATVHLAPLPGTNVALMNGLLHEIIRNDWVDHDYIAAHTVGYEELTKQVQDYPPERVAEICQVPAKQIREAAHLLGTAQRLLSTVLQGFYQSHQATAAAVQVNNVNIIRGMLGKPGAGILQMNGQPTAENTRECGADGDLPGFRNWANDSHVAELARIWNIEQMQIPHYSPPTHLMQIMRYVEQGTIRFLWVSGTNPAVSLPELRRIRSILSQQRLFLVVQDIFLTETTALADVVLPAATWGEKTGTFTNADRTVHLSEKAVEPPGQARPDLDIFWTTRGGWTSGTKTVSRCRRGTTPSRRSRRGSGAALAVRATTPGSVTRSCVAAAASSGPALPSTRTGPNGFTSAANSGARRSIARATAKT